MESRQHPNFRRRYNRNALISLGTALVTGLLAFLTLHSDYTITNTLLFTVFGSSIAYGVLSSFYRLYHVKCPTCRTGLRTRRDANKEFWVAECQACRICWGLGIQTD